MGREDPGGQHAPGMQLQFPTALRIETKRGRPFGRPLLKSLPEWVVDSGHSDELHKKHHDTKHFHHLSRLQRFVLYIIFVNRELLNKVSRFIVIEM